MFISESIYADNGYSAKRLENEWQTFRDAGMRTWHRRLLPEFQKAADKRTNDLLNKVTFRIVKFSDFNAFANLKKKEIIIPVGLIVIIHNIADAAILTWENPECANKFEEYQYTLAEIYYQKLTGESDPLLPDFAKICGIPSKEASLIRNNKDLYARKATLIVDSLAFIVGHEVGHLVLNHKPSLSLTVQESHMQEYDADAFGIELASKAGFVPGSAIFTVFPLFAMLEGEVDENGKSTHPPVFCRMHRNMLSFSEILSESAAVDGMERMGMSPDNFRAGIENLRRACVEAKNQ